MLVNNRTESGRELETEQPPRYLILLLQATDVLWAGMGPAMCLGALLSYLRLRHFRVTVVGRFARAKPGTKPKYIHK
jgi:hypothetical protein